jgi:hypothetical protein
VTLALVESGKSVPEYPVPPLRLLVFRQMALLVCGIVGEPVLKSSESPSTPMVTFKDTSPASRRFMSITSRSVTANAVAITRT